LSAIRKGVAVSVLLGLALLVTAPAAAATTRYASPTGAAATSDCTSPNPADPTNPPCTLFRALDDVAVDNDDVVLTTGTYDIGALNVLITKAIDVHGEDGQPLPKIVTTNSSFGVALNNPAAVLRRIEIDGSTEALDLFQAARAEQLVVHSNGANTCQVERGSLLRDSVCWNTAVNGIAVDLFSSMATFSAQLRNVTAVATGTGSYGIKVQAFNAADKQSAVAKNVIADGVAADVRSVAGPAGSVATVTLSSSNYATESEAPGPGTFGVTDPGPPNQLEPPLFTDADAGLFHQDPLSPTVDAGAMVDLLGSADPDGDARVLDAAPDIGADELVALPPPTPSQPEPQPAIPFIGTTPGTQPFDLAAAINRCKKKFRKGTKARKRCIKKARKRAS
jgi:hypothetical protein